MAADQPSGLSGVLRRPFREQVAFFRQKLGKLVPTRRWDDLTGAAHDTAFMVAGAQKADLLADLAASVDRAISEGKSLDAFRKDFDAAVERHDWHGWTGEGTKAGRAWRTRTIYKTNTYVAYAAGRFAQLTADDWKFWVYLHGGSEDPRPEHAEVFNGIIMQPDHPFWEKFYPPSDWGCSCYVVGANTLAQAKRLGGDPTKKLPEGWGKPNPATGEPAGIGKGWGYAPGAGVVDTVNAVTRKSSGWHYDLAKAFMDSVPDDVRDQLARSYRTLPSVADDARRYAKRVLDGVETDNDPRRTLGPLTGQEAIELGDLLEFKLDRFDWSIAPSGVRHVKKSHGDDGQQQLQGQRGVTADDYARLPEIIAAPSSIRRLPDSDLGEQLIELTKRIDGDLYAAVFAVFGKRRTLTLKTFFIRPGKK